MSLRFLVSLASRRFALAALTLATGSVLAAPGNPLGLPVQVNAAGTEEMEQQQPDIAQVPDGRVVVAWSAIDGAASSNLIMARRYAASGAAQDAPFRVNPADGSSLHARVAADAAGNFIVVWQQLDNATSPATSRIWLRRYSAAGAALSGALAVDTGIATAFDQLNPEIAMNAPGQFVISWNTRRRFKQGAYWQFSEGPVLARRYAAGGIPQGEAFEVAQRDSGLILVPAQVLAVPAYVAAYFGFAAEGPAVDLAADGHFVVAWTSGSIVSALAGLAVTESRVANGLQSIQAQRFDSAGNKLGKPSQAMSLVSWRQDHFDAPDVALTPDGGYVLAYVQYEPLRLAASRRGLFLQRYSAAGKAVGASLKVSRDAGANAETSSPSVAVDSNGNLIVAWLAYNTRAGAGTGIVSRVYASDGSELGPAVVARVADSSTLVDPNPRIALRPDGDYLLVWGDYSYDTRINPRPQRTILMQRVDGP